jgi:hypothetical protein
MLYKKLSFWGILLSCFFCAAGQPTPAGDPFANMSEEEFGQMLQFIDNVSKQFEEAYQKLSPEEQAQVDREMREILIQQGINPDNLEPLNQPQAPQLPTPSLPAQPIQPVTPAAECTATTAHQKDQVGCLIAQLISLIDTVRQKLMIAPFEIPMLRHWLDMLAFLSKTLINSPDHLARLTHEKFDRLFQLLVKLEKVLTQYEKKLVIPSAAQHEDDELVYLDPYHILGITPRASAEDITAAYEALRAAYNLEKIEQDLTAQQIKPTHMKRKINAIKLQLRNIEDAYQQLGDPKLRAQIDRNALITYQQKLSLEEEARRVAYALQNALHQLVINGVFELFDQFFAQFEPIAVARRKEMEAAEQQRRTEQEARHKLVATPSPYRGQSSEYPDWLPPYEQYAAPASPLPSYTPSHEGRESRGGGSAPSPFAEKEQQKGSEKMKKGAGGEATAKKDADKKEQQTRTRTADNKTKTAQNPVEEFSKSIKKLDELMKIATDQLALPAHQAIITTLAQDQQQLVHMNDAAVKLQNEFTLMLDLLCGNDKLMKQLETARKLGDDLNKARTTAPLINMWTAHRNRHQQAYATLSAIANTLKTIQQQNPARAFPRPWEYLMQSDDYRKQLDKLGGVTQEEQKLKQQQQPKMKLRRTTQEQKQKFAEEQQRLNPQPPLEPEQKLSEDTEIKQREQREKSFEPSVTQQSGV